MVFGLLFLLAPSVVAAGLWIDRTAGVAAALAVAAYVGTVGWFQWRAVADRDPAVADADSG